MGRPWCAPFPVVDVPKGATAKPVTLVLPYYDNPQFLRRQVAWWATYPAHLRAALRVILVDDASTDGTTAADPELARVYEAVHARFRALYPALKSVL